MSNTPATPAIGVVAGVGPFAGLDLLRKLFAQTAAVADQDHLPVIAWFDAAAIPDRTAFLRGETAVNPGHAIGEQLLALHAAGAGVAGIPCNTAHAPAILDAALGRLAACACPLRVIHLIDAVAAALTRRSPAWRCVGLLATTGAVEAGVYQDRLQPLGVRVVTPTPAQQADWVQTAVYDPVDGIKATGCGSPRVVANLTAAAVALRVQGAQAVILGCTELPLAVPAGELAGLPTVDPALMLARALIAAVAPQRLRPAPD